MGLAGHEPRAVGRAAVPAQRRAGRADSDEIRRLVAAAEASRDLSTPERSLSPRPPVFDAANSAPSAADERRLAGAIPEGVSLGGGAQGVPLQETPTKNRRERVWRSTTSRWRHCGVRWGSSRSEQHRRGTLDPDPYLFSDDVAGAIPWKPDAVSQYFSRLRTAQGPICRVPRHLRRFMETYRQELGYSVAQVAMRAGHDPSVAARHYSGRVHETDRQLAAAVATLLLPPGES